MCYVLDYNIFLHVFVHSLYDANHEYDNMKYWSILYCPKNRIKSYLNNILHMQYFQIRAESSLTCDIKTRPEQLQR